MRPRARPTRAGAWALTARNAAYVPGGATGGGVSGVINADVFLDGEAGTAGDTLTTTLLDTMTKTRADRASLGAWSITADTATDLQIVDDAPSHIVPIRVPNTTHSVGTRGIRINLNAATDENHCNYAFRAGVDKVSVGFFVKFPTIANGNSLDICYVLGSASMVMQMDGLASSQEIKLHTGNPSQFYTPALEVTPGTRYWVTMLFDRAADTCYMNVYSETGTLLAEQSLGNLTSIVDSPAYELGFGRLDGISQPTVPDPSWVTISDFVVDMENGTFPLGVASESDDTVTEGYLVADDMLRASLPVGWENYSGTPNWGGGAGGVLQVTSPALAEAIIAPVANVYFYGIFKPTTLGTSKQFLFFYDENGFTNQLSIGTAWNSKLQFYGGATGTMGTTLVQGTEYHVWLEWESGTAARVFLSESATKPTIPDANWALEDTVGVATANIGSVVLSGCSVNDWSKVRISDSVIGNNPT